MRVLIVGGGPAGLYLAHLLKRDNPAHDVVVRERNRPGDTFGFGVVFSDNTLDTLAGHDAVAHRELQQATVRWDPIEVRHRGETIHAYGHGFSAIPRVKLLQLLQGLASGVGAELQFERDVAGAAEFEGFDLVVAADGVNSVVRDAYPDAFGTTVEQGATKFAWFGTTKRFDSLTFIFEQSPHGWFGAHSYPIDDATSTFLIECDEQTWRNAGFDGPEHDPSTPGASDLLGMVYLEKLYAKHLAGGKLLANNSKWRTFPTISNGTWRYGNVVLMGDAAHTAHFSVGSGTKMALEDALALADALRENAGIDAALEQYERVRRPAVERVQSAAQPSQAWWERMSSLMERDPVDLSFHFLTRTPRVTLDGLRVRDQVLVRRFQESWTARHGVDRRTSALAASLALDGVTLANRLAVPVSGASLAEIAAPALSGAGLVVVSLDEGDDMSEAVDYVHEHTGALVMARLYGVDVASLGQVAERAAADGFDMLEVATDAGTLDAVRGSWSAERPMAARIAVAGDGPLDVDGCVAAAGAMAEQGARMVVVALPARASADVIGEGAWRALLACERIRAEHGVAVMLEGGIESNDAANTAIMSGRVDLCAGRPLLTGGDWSNGEGQ